MNHYEFINKEMLVSATARRGYRLAALASLTIFFSVPAIRMIGTSFLLKLLLFFGVVGTAVIVIGMETFLFRFDDSAAWKQILWFVLMLFAPLGPALYCFVVYSHSTAVQAS